MPHQLLYCSSCGETEAQATHCAERTHSFEIKGETIEVTAPSRVCDDCENEIYDCELSDALLQQAYAIYRERHNLLAPEQILALRERYGLSQRGLAALLGLGEVTVYRYENGSLPDDAPNHLLRLMLNPWNVWTLYQENKNQLSPINQKKLERNLSEILARESVARAATMLEASVPGKTGKVAARKQVSDSQLRTGGRDFSPQRLMDMMLFFASQQGGVFKTKLNKLLWYADFHHFRLHGSSISGARYVHLPYGPVAHGYELYLGQLRQENKLQTQEEFFDMGGSAEKLVFKGTLETELEEDALSVLTSVNQRFKLTTAKAISELSHEEAAYRKTNMGEEISYDYAQLLKIEF